MKFSDQKLKLANEIRARYPEGKQKSALLPLLHLIPALGLPLAIAHSSACLTSTRQ